MVFACLLMMSTSMNKYCCSNSCDSSSKLNNTINSNNTVSRFLQRRRVYCSSIWAKLQVVVVLAAVYLLHLVYNNSNKFQFQLLKRDLHNHSHNNICNTSSSNSNSSSSNNSNNSKRLHYKLLGWKLKNLQLSMVGMLTLKISYSVCKHMPVQLSSLTVKQQNSWLCCFVVMHSLGGELTAQLMVVCNRFSVVNHSVT